MCTAVVVEEEGDDGCEEGEGAERDRDGEGGGGAVVAGDGVGEEEGGDVGRKSGDDGGRRWQWRRMVRREERFLRRRW